jgi:hypothetical protein
MKHGVFTTLLQVRRRWWGARRSHDLVQRAGGRLLWLGDTEAVSNAGDYVEKWSYVQAIHSQCRFCKLEMLYMFRTFVSLLSGHALYILIVSRSFLRRMRNASHESCRENQNAHFMFSNFLFCLCDNLEKYCGPGQATGDNMAHVHCILDTQGYKYTLRICST